ncbi:MAG: hypothetical protein LBK66_11025, partial [Spirochaetaceae bacterium]|nr:hypothetical protein [Spirochaetaceae bacterium]
MNKRATDYAGHARYKIRAAIWRNLCNLWLKTSIIGIMLTPWGAGGSCARERESASRIYFWSFALQNSTPGSTANAAAQGIGGVRSSHGVAGAWPRKARFFAEQKMRP